MVNNPLLMVLKKVEMAGEFVHECRKAIRSLMVSLEITEFTADFRMLEHGQGTLDN